MAAGTHQSARAWDTKSPRRYMSIANGPGRAGGSRSDPGAGVDAGGCLTIGHLPDGHPASGAIGGDTVAEGAADSSGVAMGLVVEAAGGASEAAPPHVASSTATNPTAIERRTGARKLMRVARVLGCQSRPRPNACSGFGTRPGCYEMTGNARVGSDCDAGTDVHGDSPDVLLKTLDLPIFKGSAAIAAPVTACGWRLASAATRVCLRSVTVGQPR